MERKLDDFIRFIFLAFAKMSEVGVGSVLRIKIKRDIGTSFSRRLNYYDRLTASENTNSKDLNFDYITSNVFTYVSSKYSPPSI